jgi:hypothetical protein
MVSAGRDPLLDPLMGDKGFLSAKMSPSILLCN